MTVSTTMTGRDPKGFVAALNAAYWKQAELWSNGLRSAYLAGPMRGYPLFNYPLFNAVAEYLRGLGYSIENPAQTDAEVADRAAASEHPLSVYMERDLADVAKTQAVFVLPGWEESEGANIETTVAFMLGHPVYELPGYTPVSFERKAKSLAPTQTIPADSAERKATPIVSGVIDYFPAALAEVARVSKYGNDKHNPGEPLHWSRFKSADHADAIGRHLIDRGETDPETGMSHSAELAWRALAMLQIELEAAGKAPLSRGSSEA